MQNLSEAEVTVVNEPPPSWWTKKRRLLWIYVPAFFIPVGLASLFDIEPLTDYSDIILMMCVNLFVYRWCRIDSSERGFKLHPVFSFGIIIFGIIGLVFYLFRSRGLPGGFVSIGLAITYLLFAFFTVSLVLVLIMFWLAPEFFDEPELVTASRFCEMSISARILLK